MKEILLTLMMAATAVAASSQTAAKPATHPATAARPAAPSGVRLPPGVPPVRGIVKPAFTLRYEDVAIGTGAEAQYRKVETVQYTGYLGSNGRADDGHKFDSSYTRQLPVFDEKHNPVMGPDGKPKMTDPHPEPFDFIEGDPRLIPGWNLGIDGMKVGGKRRIFIPYQLAYGAQGRPGPDADHPGIPPKSDLIFDIELLGVKEMQMPAGHPGMGMTPHAVTPAPATQPAAQGQPAVPAAPAQPK